MRLGVLWGVAAGALWGLAFVGPALIAPFGALEITVIRYLVFGAASVAVLMGRRFNPWQNLTKRDWWLVLVLGFTGNTLYFSLMSGGVVLAGSAPVALIICALPIAMAVVGNFRRRTLPWAALTGPLLIILVGLTITAMAAISTGTDKLSGAGVWGVVLAFASLLVWLYYGIKNAEYLADHPQQDKVIWTSLLGLGTLATIPLVILVIALTGGLPAASAADWRLLLGWGLALGLGASWIATWFWNRASAVLPAAILGMLIVFETLFAIVYTCLIDHRWPVTAEVLSAVFIIVGVVWGLRVKAKYDRLKLPPAAAVAPGNTP